MGKEEIFSKLNIKDYNNELEKVLDKKTFSEDAKNLLISMLYKVEVAYADYNKVKVDTPSKKEIMEELISIIENDCDEIEIIKPTEDDNIQLSNRKFKVDKSKNKISLYPNANMLMFALYKLSKKEFKIKKEYEFIKKPVEDMLNIGLIMHKSEIIRDFDGWNWNIDISNIKDEKYNLVYQNLIILLSDLFINTEALEATDTINTIENKLLELYGEELSKKICNIIYRICLLEYLKQDKSKINAMLKIKEELVEKFNNMNKKEIDLTKKYWKKYLKDHDTVKLPTHNSEYMNKLNKIYKRTILLFPLLTNQETGGISAGVEIDENRTKCGRYSYCWPRDGIFITNALDILNMKKETEKFYKNFCKITQSKNGMWEQRFYTDGKLAPCWGYQIDETASVVYGVYNHYKVTKDIKFLKDTLKMCEMAVKYLKKYITNIFEEKEEYKSYDIWEENEGIHTYSLVTIFSSFDAMNKIYEIVAPEFKENRLKIEKINKEKLELEKCEREIKDYILKNLYDNNKKTFIRNKDGKIDISLLGLVTPFNMFAPKEKKILNTVDKIDLTLRTYTGGYLRYEGDNYVGGNPWVIANLWMANYYIEQDSKKKAKECFDFVVKTATEHGFLGEQIDNNDMKAKWVIGLGWSHAMFIDVLKKLYEYKD